METTTVIDSAFWSSDQPVALAAPFDVGALGLSGIGGLVFFASSGSTGRPRWIGLSREALLWSAAAVNRHLGVGSNDVWGLALPPFHVGGFGVLARAHECGTRPVAWRGRWNAAGFAAWLTRLRVTRTSLVPTQVHDLVTAELRAPECLRSVVVGGGLLPLATGRAARALGWPVLASYGMTEAGSQVATQTMDQLAGPYAATPLPVLPEWEVRIGESGRIAIRGGGLFAGQLVEEGSGWSFRARQGDWFETSDRGELDSGGLVVHGRIDSVVKVLGELVDPVAIEARLGLDGIAVVALPDGRKEHRLLVVFDRSVERWVVERAVSGHNAGCPGFERLDGPVEIPELPRSPLGKLRRQELTEWLRPQ